MHIVLITKLTHATTLSIHICVDDITSLAHEVFYVLPAGRGRKLREHYAPFTATTGTANLTSVVSVSVSVSARVAARITSSTAAALGVLYTQAITIKCVAISSTNGIISISLIVVRNEAEGRWAGLRLDINVNDFPVLVEKVINLPFPNVHGEITDVQTISHDE